MKKSIALILLGVTFITGCKQETLFTGLDQIQVNEVVALLQQNNIKAEKNNLNKAGYSVSVSPDDFPAAVGLMAAYNLPSRPRLEIAELFPADALVSSPRAEVARINSGIEQRLEQTLNQMNGVVSSRVHVSYDMNNTETDKNKQPVHISALLRIVSELHNETSVIADVKRVLRNSFNNVDYDDISVVLTPVPANYLSVERKKNQDLSLYVYLALAFFITLGMITYIVTEKLFKERGLGKSNAKDDENN